MRAYPLALVDPYRLETFTLLGRSRDLFDDPMVWTDDNGIPWIAAQGTSGVIGLTTLGNGWVWDEQACADPVRQQQLAARLQAIQSKNLNQHRNELTQVLGQLRLGGHAERLLWAIHRAVLASGRSLLRLPDTYLAQAVWSNSRPRHWHQVLGQVLRSLTWLHVADLADGHPAFGPDTVLLTHVGDLRGEPEDRCQDDCDGIADPRHHHFQIDVGPGFLGELEQFAQTDEQTGIRSYEFPTGKKKDKGLTLRKMGKTGRLVTVYLPAKVGCPAACQKLNDCQHRLLQAIIRETTRATRVPRQLLTQPEVISGNVVKDLSGKRQIPCPLLSPSGQYVAFNGNGVRRGTGYRLLTPGGWLAKAGYRLDEMQLFLDDLAGLSLTLGLTAVGLHGSRGWLDLEQLLGLPLTASGRRCLDDLHLRVYAGADYLARWNSTFGWKDASSTDPVDARSKDSDPATYLAGLLAAKNLSVRKLAAELGVGPSFLSKVLRGKPCPKQLLEKAKAWEADPTQARPFPAPTQVNADKPKVGTARSMLTIAKELLHRGWSVVPQPPGAEHPSVKWKPFQDQRPTEQDLENWWQIWPDAGLALILGPVSNLFAIDVDGPEAHAALLERLGSEPRAPKALSGSRKPFRYHLFFRHPDLPTKAKATPWHPKLEFRGHRGIVIIPPSLHKSGNTYAWAPDQSPDDLELPEVPAQILESLKPPRRPSKSWGHPSQPVSDVSGIDASRRTLEFLSGRFEDGPHWNDRLFQAACDLCGRDMPLDQAEPLLLTGARPWNVGEEELARKTIQSAYSQPRMPGRR